MIDFNVTFLGGALEGQNRSPMNEKELGRLGYRVQNKGQAVGSELAVCIAVPAELSVEDGHLLVRRSFGKRK